MSKCVACSLSSNSTNAIAGWGNPLAPLVIVLDCPGEPLAEKLLIWILRKLSLTSEDVWIDYTFKCPVRGQKKEELSKCHAICWNLHPRAEVMDNKSLVVAGNWSSTFVGYSSLRKMNGRKDENGIWYIYSFTYLLFNPAECLRTWRVLYKAAEEAGLKPYYQFGLEDFKFPSKKI